jgi:hypothetical protein
MAVNGKFVKMAIAPSSLRGCRVPRREVLAAIGSLAILGCDCLSHRALAGSGRPRRYCGDSSSGQDGGEAVPLSNFSREAVVAYMERENDLLKEYFGIGGSIYIAIGSYDAFMDGESRIITIGDGYIDRYAGPNEAYGLLRMSGVLAHETGHIFQTNWNMDNMLSSVNGYVVKYIELHADYMAGAYIAWRQRLKDSAPRQLASFFYNIGDQVPDRERHHGTEAERHNAFAAGYNDAEPADDAKRAAAKGLIYVRKVLG